MSDLRAAVAAGVLASEEQHKTLLLSIVEVARAMLGAKASSIMLFDEAAGELVFEAVAGEGADTLVGQRFSADKGIAGWVLSSRQSLVVEDVASDERFATDVAHSSGYVPKGILAVPLLTEENVLGVLEVLDRPERATFSLAEMDRLGLFANQAAIALEIVQRARSARAALEEAGAEASVVAGLAKALEELEPDQRERALRLLTELTDLL